MRRFAVRVIYIHLVRLLFNLLFSLFLLVAVVRTLCRRARGIGIVREVSGIGGICGVGVRKVTHIFPTEQDCLTICIRLVGTEYRKGIKKPELWPRLTIPLQFFQQLQTDGIAEFNSGSDRNIFQAARNCKKKLLRADRAACLSSRIANINISASV